MIIVHHLNNSRSQRILWLLEELGLPYEIKRYQRDPKTNLAPPELKGLALGFYNTAQAAGLFLGGSLGGALVVWGGAATVFWAACALSALWLAVTWGLQPLGPKH